MRITQQLLRKHSREALGEVERLDLSGKEISVIERLDQCRNLQSLVLSNNRISALQNIDCCHQLWAIDLTGNRIKSLQGLAQFPVLGSLRLACNELEWAELPRLSHMTLLSLTLSGNPQLDSDPHYREHVVDILPNLWVLDERLITADERKQVSQFFLKSESSAQPVWRRASDKVFVPSFMKNLLVTGVFGEKTTHMMSHFPVSYTHNTDMDRRRLHYVAHTMEQDMQLEVKYRKHLAGVGVPQLTRLVEGRERDTEQSNMLLLLLLAHLEYGLPHDVMRATLETAKLTKIGGVECMSVFGLPSHMMRGVASLLLCAATVDRQDKNEGGVYKKLFQSLCHVLDSQQRKAAAISVTRPSRVGRRKRKPTLKEKENEAHLQCLLASEVVHLLCLVPLFFQQLETHPGLLQLVCVATSNPHVGDVISSLTWKVQARGGDAWDVYHDVASFLLQSTSDIVQGKRRGLPLQRQQRLHSGVQRATSQLLPSTQPTHPSLRTRALSASHLPRPQPHSSSHHHPSQPHPRPHSPPKPPSSSHGYKEPELGDLVLFSTESLARIVALPERSVAVLQLTSSNTSLSVAPDSYFYTETEGLEWDQYRGYWIKDDLAADLSEIQLQVEPASISRATTPDPIFRPHSGMSFVSEFDLQTIPSEAELDIRSESPATTDHPPMRVDICDSRPPSRSLNTDEAKTEHQKQVLSQLNSEQQHNRESDVPPTTAPLPSPHHILSLSLELKLPSPQIHLLQTWECSKSITPATTHSSTRPHSCHDPPPLPPPSPSATSSSPPPLLPHSVSTLSFHSPLSSSSRASERDGAPAGVVHHAWSPVWPGRQPKQTILSTSRLMNRRETRTPTSAKRKSTSGAPGGQQCSTRGVGGGDTATVIVQPKTAKMCQSPPSHMSAYMASAKKTAARYQYNVNPHNSCKAPSTRQLGDVRTLYIGGTSIT